jgi:hypothetical protein
LTAISIRNQIYLYDGTLKGTSCRARPDAITTLDTPAQDGPLVSCLMVTRGNPDFVAAAMRSFQRQSYPNTELVIVAQTMPDHLRQLAADDPRIRLVEAGANLSLGALRNLSVASARGEIVCQWDDDDLYGTDRVARGVGVLLQTRAAAVFLRQFLLWAPAARKLRLARSRVWEGSMLAFRAALPPYPDLPRHEDRKLVKAMNGLRIAVLDDPLSYVYCIHGANTFQSAHMQSLLASARLHLHYRSGLAGLAELLPVAGHPALPEADRTWLAANPAPPIALRSLQRYVAFRQRLKRLDWRIGHLLSPPSG